MGTCLSFALLTSSSQSSHDHTITTPQVRVAGIVTRCSDVKPLVEVATYTCDQCGFEIYQEVGLKTSFTPISTCPSNYCRENSLTGKLFMQTRGSKFIKYQELKLQELPDQVIKIALRCSLSECI